MDTRTQETTMRAMIRKNSKPTKPVVQTPFRVLSEATGQPVGNVVLMDPAHPDTKAREARGEIVPATQADRDPFGCVLSDADRLELDPFGGQPENWSLPGCDWPPADAAELAALDRWADECEREQAGRE